MYRILLVFIFLVSIAMANYAAACGISLVMKGTWKVSCNDALISQHNRYDKAIEAVVNQNKDCHIIPPDRIEIRLSDTTPKNQTVTLSWSIPTLREDGADLNLSDIAGYFIYESGVQYFVSGGETVEYSLTLPIRVYSFTISTVTKDGVEGKKSEAVTTQVIN